MKPDDIYSALTELIGGVIGDDTIVIGPLMTAADFAGWDSANHIAILVAVEMRFGIKFHTSEVEDLSNIGALVGLIEKKRNGARR
jgi:acyl carrier protein